MASSLYKFQCAKRVCDEHENKELASYCKTCKRTICSSCVKAYHINHDWELILDLAREMRTQLPQECKRIKETEFSALKRRVFDEYAKALEKLEGDFHQSQQSLNDMRDDLISGVNELISEKQQLLQKSFDECRMNYERKRDELKIKIDDLEKKVTTIGTEVNSFSDFDILEMEQEMISEIESAKSESTNEDFYTPVFTPGKINLEVINKMIGEVESFTIEEITSFKLCTSRVGIIEPTSECTAWVRTKDNGYARLINDKGVELRQMTLTCCDLCVTSKGTIAFTQNKSNLIKFMDENEDDITSIETTPLQPTCISSTDKDDILVTLIDNHDFFSLKPTSRRIVQRMTLKGVLLNTYEFGEDGKTRLFTYPTRTTETKNMDVCVINYTSNTSGELIIMQRDGKVKCTYHGQMLTNRQFAPNDVTSTVNNRIFVTDAKQTSKSIHILNAEGYLLGVFSFFDDYPMSVSVHMDKLWVGFNNGKMKIFSYSHKALSNK